MDSLKSNLVLIESAPEAQTASPTQPEAAGDTPGTSEVTPAEKSLLGKTTQEFDGLAAQEEGRKVLKERLVNRLNYTHFQDEVILVQFAHRQYERTVSVPAVPQPCHGDVLECHWAETADVASLLRSYDIKHILVSCGQKFIKAVPEILSVDEQGARLALPEISFEISHRRVERQRCHGISVYVIQNSTSFSGALLDFTTQSFRVELTAAAPQSFEWIDSKRPVNVIFFVGNQTLYSGECTIVRHTQDASCRSYVLEPLRQEIQRYPKAEYRSQRQTLNPSPNIIFRHPLTQKRVELKVVDLSGSGFSVEEDEHNGVLITGLILPEIEMRLANVLTLTCSVQVVFRRVDTVKEKTRSIRCGLALIDISAQDHVKLLAMLHQVQNRNSYVCNDLDLDALWDFLFETGFIYPKKYALIHANKEQIKQTYQKLYTRSPEIARHFVYQDNGTILAHMATIRFWKSSWLIHHHAARKSALNRAGLIVLDQIGRFSHDTFRLRGLHMDYLVCYYQPKNRFPSRVFGGAAKFINDRQGCSVDAFAYMACPEGGDGALSLPARWEFGRAESTDVADLEYLYDRAYGGPMLKALDLQSTTWQDDDLCQEFRKCGFRRERHLFTLKEDGRLKAFLIANVSDVGLNLSDLTNCITALVVEPTGLAPDVLATALRMVRRITGQEQVPVLVFPATYAKEAGLPSEKVYNLWVFHMHSQSQTYFRYMNRLLKHA
jgi:hypothetical protein